MKIVGEMHARFTSFRTCVPSTAVLARGGEEELKEEELKGEECN